LELHTTRSTAVRFDLGDTLIRFTNRGFPNRIHQNESVTV
jgi:hypothetical protein